MKHLNEDTLIQFGFDLLEADEKQAAQQHLDTCTECQAALGVLKAKFAAMDTLAADEIPTDELIARTITHSQQKPGLSGVARRAKTEAEAPGSRHPVPNVLHRVVASCRSRSTLLFRWSAAAAAAAIVCILLLQNLPETRVKDTEPKETPVAKVDAPSPILTRAFPDDRMAALSSQDSVGTTSQPLASGTRASSPRRVVQRGQDARVPLAADAIPDTPPFAPASAIELVVLPAPDKTQVTIYNSADLTLVRDTRRLTLKPGWNWLQFMWDGTLIDPTSLSLMPLEYADKIDIQQLVYPARLKDIGRWLIRSEVEGAVPFEITYFASGLSWRAFYMGTMNENETTMNLKGYVNVSNNSGQDFVNTQTRLIVGQTHLIDPIPYLARRPYPYGPEIVDGRTTNWDFDFDDKRNYDSLSLGDMPAMGRLFSNGDLAGGTSMIYEIKQIEKTGLSEYFLYTIEGTEDLTNQWSKRLPSFDVNDIPVKSLYKYDEDRYGKEAVRFVSFKNDAEHELGETPIPEGSIKIYRNVNEAQNLSYIGGTDIKYIPVNEDVELNLGPAQLVKIEPALMETKTENHTFDTKGNIDGWDDIETWQIKLANTRDVPVDIEITRNFGTDTWELELDSVGTRLRSTSYDGQAAHPTFKKHDKNRARFTLTLEPKSETTFSYTVTQYQGRRNEYYTNKIQEQEK